MITRLVTILAFAALLTACSLPVPAPTGVPTTLPSALPSPTSARIAAPTITPSLPPAARASTLWFVSFAGPGRTPVLQSTRLDESARPQGSTVKVNLALEQSYPGPRLNSLSAAPGGRTALVILMALDSPQLYLLDLAAGRASRFLADPARVSFLGWGPQGQSAFFLPGPGSQPAFQVDLASGQRTNLPARFGTGTPPVTFALSASPDGRTLADALLSQPDAARPQSMLEIGLRPAPDQPRQALCAIPDGASLSALNLAWSPDGQRLAWIATVQPRSAGAASQTQLWLAELGARTCRMLASLADGVYYTRGLAWSPDSQRLAAVRVLETKDGEIWRTELVLVDPTSGKVESLLADDPARNTNTSPGPALLPGFGISHPVWSPDGRWLAFTRSSGPTGEVQALELSSRRAQTLAGPTPPLSPFLWLADTP